MSKPKICLFDASGYIFRAYYALPPLTTKNGILINAVYGFSRMLSKALSEEKPDYIAICFDTAQPTFRHEAYVDYKANRTEPDENLIKQIPLTEELVHKWGLPIAKKGGFEADDVIATLARKAEKNGMDVLIHSGDKDILQLVNKSIRVKDDMRQVIYDEAKVFEKYGLTPIQLVDYLSLMGDSVDNIKGVPGVGPKTASKLLGQYKNLEELFKHTKEQKPKLQENLEKYEKQIFENRFLVTLKEDVELNEDMESFKQNIIDKEAFQAYLKELDFRGDFYGLGESAAIEDKPLANETRKTHVVWTQEDLDKLCLKLKNSPRLAYDLETNSIDSLHCEIVGVSISVAQNEAWYIPVGHFYMGCPSQLPWSVVMPALKPLFEDRTKLKCAQNMKFDNTILQRYGITPSEPLFDTMIAAYCLEADRNSYGLKDLAAAYLNEKMTRYDEVMGGDKKKTIDMIPVEVVADYAGADAEVTFRLADLFANKIHSEGYDLLMNKIEMPLVSILQDMEKEGILIDVDFLKKVGEEFKVQINSIQAEIFKMVGEEFSLNSPKQLGKILFEKLNLPPVKKTKTGFSTNESVLQKLKDKHPVCERVLDYRELSKLVSTYVEGMVDKIDQATGRIHSSFNQTGTSTGRLSSTSPNLQNIPIRTEQGRKIRQAFIASKGNILISADYSQIDLRALAFLSKDPILVKTFNDGGDVHTLTASEVFHVSIDDVTPDMRRKAKAINFGIVYGQQAWGLSQSLGIPIDEAKDFIAKYFEKYSGVKIWIEATLENARKTLTVQTLAGRKRAVKDINSSNNQMKGFAERIAINTPIQGSSADIIKAAMIRLFKRFSTEGFKAKMLVQVHDDLLFDVPEQEIDKVIPVIKEEMENAFELDVPLLVDIKLGKNWNEMTAVKEKIKI